MRLSRVVGLALAAATWTSVAGAQTISSAANQSFAIGDPNTAMTTITVTDAGTPTITAANDLRIRIPAGFNMTWNTALTTATLGGSAAGKVATAVTYEDAGQTLVLDVTANFAGGQVLTVAGLQFSGFTTVSGPPSKLQLVLAGASGATAAADNRTKAITAAVIALSSAANQTFVVGAPNTTMSTITVTDAATPRISAANDLRIRIPAGFNMVWNTALTTATIGGGAAGKVSTTVSYENAGEVLVLNVTSNFAASDQITVSGLQFTSFTAVSAASNLEAIVQGAAGVAADTDNRTKTIVAPTLSGAADQAFVVGQAATAMSTITVTDAGTPTITAASDLRIRIPAGFNMTWNTALTTATLGGNGAGKVATVVTYEDAGQTLVLDVTANFVGGQVLTIAGLQFSGFTAVSAAAPLQLVVSGSGGGTAATDNRTKQIYPPISISSAANQTFVVGNLATANSAITVSESATPTITAANDLRIRIPAGFNMVWNTALTTATIGGGAAGKVSTTVSYENAGEVLVLNVTSNFAAGDQITVSGLQFTSFTAVSAATALQLVESGSSGGATVATDDKAITIVAPTLTGAAGQVFTVGDPATAMTATTITDATPGTITAANDLRLRIPASLNMVWNTAVTTATITGSGASKVSTTVTYANGNKDVVIDVTSSFAAGDQITVSGLQFTSFTAVSAPAGLQLLVAGASGGVAATSTTTKTIVAPTLTGAANQIFTVGDPATAMTTSTITDASTPSITSANDIRLRIPAALNMVWNTSLTTATIGGAAAAKVSSTVTYEDAGKTLVLNVTTTFAASDQITVSGLQFTSFTATSAATALQLVVSGSGGGTAATSTTTQQIVQPTIASAASQTFTAGILPVTMSTITVTSNATASTITAANDIRIRIPAGFNMTWNASLTTATIGGAAAAKVSTTVSYEDAGKTLVLNVTANFAAADQITIAGLQYNTFTAASAADNLQLVISGAGGGTANTDTRTVTIVSPTISSAANQAFVVAQGATAMSTITVTDASTAGITATNDIRIRIPATFSMTWNTAMTTATIGGGAAASVSTTVSYEDAGKTLVLNVTTSFTASQQITVSGLQFKNFTAASPSNWLQLVISGSAGYTAALDAKTIAIGEPTISSAANQAFAVGQGATAMSTITVTDAATATITAANEIRIRIPSGFNMSWNTAVTTATIGGGAAGKVSSTVSYENSGQVLVVNVTTNFAGSDQIVVSGLQYTNFTAISSPGNLELDVLGAGGATASTDDKTITVATFVAVSPHSASASQLPSNGVNYTATATVTNPGTGTDSYDLLTAKRPGTAITTVSITGAGVTQGANPDSARLSSLAPSASAVVTLTYSVGAVAAGTIDTLVLTARSTTNGAAKDSSKVAVTVVRPLLTVTKQVAPLGVQLPGTDLTYLTTVTNTGSQSAQSVVFVDSLSGSAQFQVGSVVNNIPVSVTVAYSSDAGATWTYVPASGACGAPAGYDRCVNRIRWTLLASLSSVVPNNTGTAQFVSRIR